MKKTMLALSVALLAGVAQAGTWTEDVYVSGSVGGTQLRNFDNSTFTPAAVSTDKSDYGLRLATGWQFHRLFAVELGYADLGKVSYDLGTGVEKTNLSAYDLSLVGRQGLTRDWALTGKLGFAHTKSSTAGVKSSQDTLVYGLGADYTLNKQWTLTGNWDRYHNFDDSNMKLDTLSVGLKYRF